MTAPETLPVIAREIVITATRLSQAKAVEDRRNVQRMHIAAVARHLADRAVLGSRPPKFGWGDPIDPLDVEFIVVEAAPLLFASHGLGANVLPEAECRDIAAQAYLDRLHDLTIGGVPWGRA